MRLTPIPTPTISGPRNGGSISFAPALGRGPQGIPGPGSAAWVAGEAVTTGAVRQAPDGSYIKSTASRTTRPSFDATEQGFWTSVGSDPTTFDGIKLSASYAGKGGKTKLDGQSIRNLRRPTLTVDKMWPNARTDHQVVWVDETAQIAYAISQGNRLVKSAWVSIGDEAMRWGTPTSGAATGYRWCDNGVFMRLPNGNLLMEENRASDLLTTLKRSTDDGANWTTVWTASEAARRFLGPQSLVRDANTGYLYLIEYTSDPATTTAVIWRSTDNGANWTSWVSKTRHNSNAGTIRHWHSGRYDSVSQRVYFFAGDTNDIAGIYRTNSGGTDVDAVLLNNQMASLFPDNPTSARCVDLMFFPNYLVWACDGGGGQPGVYRMHRNQIGVSTPTVERICDIDNTGWWAVNASSDGSVWVCGTSTEYGAFAWTPDSKIAHLYAVTDDGSHVDEVAAMHMDGTSFASLSGLGGASGSGAAFWMRAHTFQQAPFQTLSAFQFRARLGNGVVELRKPETRTPEYRRISQNSGPISVAAGATALWGHTRVPRKTTRLNLHDYGSKALAGTFGSAKLEVWNATTATKLFEWSGQSIVYDGTLDTAEIAAQYACAAGDQIEFKVTNTDASSITAHAYVLFSFSFS